MEETHLPLYKSKPVFYIFTYTAPSSVNVIGHQKVFSDKADPHEPKMYFNIFFFEFQHFAELCFLTAFLSPKRTKFGTQIKSQKSPLISDNDISINSIAPLGALHTNYPS